MAMREGSVQFFASLSLFCISQIQEKERIRAEEEEYLRQR